MARTKQPVLRAFGGVLRHLRERCRTKRQLQKLSTAAVARIVRAELLKRTSQRVSFDGSTLWRWEEGEVRKTDPLVLRELALYYDVRFDRLLDLLESNLREPNLSLPKGLELINRPDVEGGEAVDERSIAPGRQTAAADQKHTGGSHVGVADQQPFDASRLAELFTQFPALFPSLSADPHRLAAELASTGALLLRMADAIVWRQIAVVGGASATRDAPHRTLDRQAHGSRGRQKP